jgi:phosphoserine phosphatase RsbU/P
MKRRSSIHVTQDRPIAEALDELQAAGASSAAIMSDGRIVGYLAAAPPPSLDGRSGAQDPLIAELRLARKIQQQLLPRMVPRIPGLQVFGTVQPATDVGGDYWSVKYYRPEGRVTLKLADVTGHGIAAALLVPAVKYISGGFYRGAESPEWVMARTNHVLVQETPVEILVSMVYAWYEVESRLLSVVNAGHKPVFIIKHGKIIDIPPTGPVLGLLETDYTHQDYTLDPGDVLFACSDGIIEARVGDGRLNEEWVKGIVLNHANAAPGELAEAVLDECARLSPRRDDDRSILVARCVQF